MSCSCTVFQTGLNSVQAKILTLGLHEITWEKVIILLLLVVVLWRQHH